MCRPTPAGCRHRGRPRADTADPPRRSCVWGGRWWAGYWYWVVGGSGRVGFTLVRLCGVDVSRGECRHRHTNAWGGDKTTPSYVRRYKQSPRPQPHLRQDAGHDTRGAHIHRCKHTHVRAQTRTCLCGTSAARVSGRFAPKGRSCEVGRPSADDVRGWSGTHTGVSSFSFP